MESGKNFIFHRNSFFYGVLLSAVVYSCLMVIAFFFSILRQWTVVCVFFCLGGSERCRLNNFEIKFMLLSLK